MEEQNTFASIRNKRYCYHFKKSQHIDNDTRIPRMKIGGSEKRLIIANYETFLTVNKTDYRCGKCMNKVEIIVCKIPMFYCKKCNFGGLVKNAGIIIFFP